MDKNVNVYIGNIMKNKKYITIPELAKLLGVSRIAVYNRVKKGQIHAEKVGKTYIITDDTIRDILGKDMTVNDKKIIEAAVKKTVEEYGEVLQMLGKE